MKKKIENILSSRKEKNNFKRENMYKEDEDEYFEVKEANDENEHKLLEEFNSCVA